MSRRSRTFIPRFITMCASASIEAAPPMSFFMLSMALSGLISRPPESKHTPLPMSVILGSPGSPQVRSMRRGARCERARRRFEVGRPEVVGRGVDEVAREGDAVDDAGEIFAVDVAGQLELHLFCVLLAVAGEAVCAEREGERREP